MFQLWAYTGMRTGELIGLCWKRVAPESITVQETTTVGIDKDRPKTKAGARKMPLLPAARQALDQRWLVACAPGVDPGPEDRVCPYGRGRKDGAIWNYGSLAAEWERAHYGTAIVYRNPYQLRHTFASQLLSQGGNLALIAKLLGHKGVEMVTRTYGRWVGEGEALGFDRPPRAYGMTPIPTPITACEIHVNSHAEQGGCERSGAELDGAANQKVLTNQQLSE